MTFFRNHAEETSQRKDIEIDRMQAEMEKMKRERVDQMAGKNMKDLQSNIWNALQGSK